MKEYPQGSTINFIIKFKENNQLQLKSFDDIQELYIFVFTNSNYIVKFSKNKKEGFIILERIDNKNLLCNLTDTQTINMLGDLYLEQKVKVLDSNNKEDVGVSKLIDTGITIIESLVSKNYDI